MKSFSYRYQVSKYFWNICNWKYRKKTVNEISNPSISPCLPVVKELPKSSSGTTSETLFLSKSGVSSVVVESGTFVGPLFRDELPYEPPDNFEAEPETATFVREADPDNALEAKPAADPDDAKN